MRRPGGAPRRVPPALAWAASLALGAACASVRPWTSDESHRIEEAMRGPAFDGRGPDGAGIALGPAPPVAAVERATHPPTHRRRPGRPASRPPRLKPARR